MVATIERRLVHLMSVKQSQYLRNNATVRRTSQMWVCLSRWISVIILCGILGGFLPSVEAKETDTAEPIQGISASVQPDLFTGVLTTSVPLLVPPGRNGMQPSLALTYESSGGNEWVGMGWKMGLGAVERQTRFGVDYAAHDYTLGVNGIAGDLVPAPSPAPSTEYRLKIEGPFVRVQRLTAGDGQQYFVATDKSGTTYSFGQTAASRVVDSADAARIFKWGLDRVEDRDGNYLTVSYTKDQNQIYLNEVAYAGNGSTTPTNVVTFHLEARPDTQALYVPNFKVVTAKRLKSIDVQANSARVRAYQVTYASSQTTGRSLLASIQQFGSDAVFNGSYAITSGTAFPPVSLGYEAETIALGEDSVWGTRSYGINCIGTPNCRPAVSFADVNGDGRADVVYERTDVTEFRVLLSSGTSFGTDTAWGSRAYGVACTGASNCLPNFTFADVNGDGKADFIYQRTDVDEFRVLLSTGTGFGTDTAWGSKSYGVACLGSSNCRPGFAWTDVNGDGKVDFVYHRSDADEWRVLLSTGTSFGTDTAWGTKAYGIACIGATNCQPSFSFVDLNGDGRTDVVYERTGTTEFRAMLSTGTSFATDTAWGARAYGIGCAGASNCVPAFGFFDGNGDGKADFIYHRVDANQFRVLLSTGSGFDTDTDWGDKDYGVACAGSSNCQPAFGYFDTNGDGKSDFVYNRDNSNDLRAVVSNGADYNPDALWGTRGAGISCVGPPTCQPSFSYIDVTGDGKADFTYIQSDNNNLRVAPSGPGKFLLTSVTNGLGGATTIAYVYSPQYTNTQLPIPFATVSSLTTCDNWSGSSCTGTSSVTSYLYSGGFYHIAERDLRGFNYVKVTGPTGPSGEQAITETWFHQGNDVAVDTNNPNVAVGYTKGLPYRVKVTDAAGFIFSNTTTAYVADGDSAAPYFTPVGQADASLDNGAKQTRTVYADYDAYGNVLREDQSGDLSTTSDDRTVVRTFGNNTTDWLLGFPTSETVYQGIGLSPQVAQSTFYYDGTTSCTTASTNQTPTKGHLTRTVRWLNGGTNPETRVAYDAYGNLTCTRDANGNTSTVAHDATNTFPTTATNALSQVTTTQYYGIGGQGLTNGVFGQVKSVTDANSQTTAYEYDPLSRLTKTTAPDGLVTTTTYNYGSGFSVGTQHVFSSSSGAGVTTALTSANYFDGLGRSVKTESSGPDNTTIVTEVQYDNRGAVRKRSLPYFKTVESVTGRWSTLQYDALGRLTRLDLPDGTRSLACTSAWVTVSIDTANHRKRDTKDAYGRTVRVDEYQGTTSTCDTTVGTPYATTTYQYDTLGNLLSVTDAKGNVTTMTYDTLSRKTAMHDPDMGDWSYLYDAVGNLTKQTDAKSQLLWFRYDALNRRTQKDFTTQKSPGAGDVVYTYDGGTYNRNGRLQQVVDASGTVVFRYDALGRITQTDKTLDGTTYTTQSTYDGLGRLLTVTYPGSPTTVMSYAYNGPLLDKVFDSTTTYIQYSQYNALGQAGLTRYGNGVTTTKTYAQTTNTVCSQQNFRLCTLKTAGPAGVLTASAGAPGTSVNLSTEGTTDWAHWGLTTASSFNHKSGVTAQISTFSTVGGGTAQRFDDNPTTYTWTGGTPTASATNSPTGVYIVGLNKGFQLTVPADTTPRTVKLYLGGWGAQAKFEATLSDQSAAGYTDTSFNDSGSGDGTNRVYTLTYQAASPNQTLTLTWTVTGMNDPQWGNVSLQGATLVTGSVSGALAGSLATPSATVTLSTEGTTDWAHWGLTTASSFNHKSGITAQISNYSALGGGTAARYDTNPNGYSWTDGTPTASATNSPTGLYINGLNKGFQITVPADTTSRTVKVYVGVWGAQGKLEATLSDSSASAYVDTSVTDPGGSSDGIARVYTLTYRAGSANQTLTVKWTVETMHEAQWGNVTLQGATLVTNSNSGTVYQDLQYAYTADGNLTTIADHTVAGGAGDQAMTYDSLDRLTEAEGPYGTGGATASITYSYNEIGNLTANSQVGTYTYPTSGSSSVRPHAVSAAGSNSYTYDANGNMTAGAGRSFTYNLENKPLTITIGGQTTTFVYDGDNGRVKKIVGTTTTRYISQLYECENTSCSRMIFAGSERVATLVPGGGVHYYHPDHLGSSSVITDGTGAKAQNLTYFPYGATRTNSSPVTPAVDVPYKYTGQELDASTTLYNYKARQYEAALGRFVSPDTVVPDPFNPQDLNRYAYVRNSPLNYTDPTGQAGDCVGDIAAKPECQVPDVIPVREVQIQDDPLYPTSPPSSPKWPSRGRMSRNRPTVNPPVTNPGVADPLFSRSDTTSVSKNIFTIGFFVPNQNPDEAQLFVPGIGGIIGAGGRSSIRITSKGLTHIRENHTIQGKLSAKKSQFSPEEDIVSLIKASESLSPTVQETGKLERIVDAGRTIGVDRNTQQATSIYTVITDLFERLITAFPGKPYRP
ncbi:MAG: hypothetical protein DCC63_13640 [Nitrospira sp.]|nr:MAG: hypothetical protein DCC63_13640 [Nitrospira sp.]